MNILGISTYCNDSAALGRDGDIIAAAQDKRFSRKRHDARFPAGAINSCLNQGGIKLAYVEKVVFYDMPPVKFERRMMETYLSYAPHGSCSFVAAMSVWLKENLYLRTTLRKELATLGGLKEKELPQLMIAGHHQSHSASAFYPSPIERAAVLCLDGVGEWATTSVWLCDGNKPSPHWAWDVSGLFAAFALILPAAFVPAYKISMKIGHVPDWINTRLILGLVIVLLFAPIALMFMLFDRDPMERKLDNSMVSYRNEIHHLPREQMEKPFR